MRSEVEQRFCGALLDLEAFRVAVERFVSLRRELLWLTRSRVGYVRKTCCRAPVATRVFERRNAILATQTAPENQINKHSHLTHFVTMRFECGIVFLPCLVLLLEML